MKTYTAFIFMLLFFVGNVYSQTSKKQLVRKGNAEYKDKKYAEAEIEYRKAVVKDSLYFKANFNLANTLYNQKKYKEASLYYAKLLTFKDITNTEKAELHYNLANSYLQQGLNNTNAVPSEDIKKAIEQYKKSLRLNPTNKNAKYNLAYAQKYLQQDSDLQAGNNEKKSEAERTLNVLKNNEKKTLEKVKSDKENSNQIEKDW